MLESIRIARILMWNEWLVLSSEGVAGSGGKVRQRHLMRAADFRIQVMHPARVTVGREPSRQRIRIKERAIDLFRLRGQNAVQANSVGHGRDHSSYHDVLRG